MAGWVVYQAQVSQPPDFTISNASNANTRTRRQHSKSRTGCTVCKQRRIKCDETKPACKQCVDYGRQCVYSIMKPQVVTHEPEQRSATDHDACSHELFEQVWEKLQAVAELCTLAELSIQKTTLRTLLSHFIGCQDEWLPAAPTFQQTLQKHGVELGLRSQYLLHAILAVSASHLQYLDPTKVELKLVYGFHNALFLRGYREKLDNIEPEDADALFACGRIHTIMAIRHTLLDALATPNGFDSLLLGLKSIKTLPAFRCLLHSENGVTNGPFNLFLAHDIDGENILEVNQEVSRKTLHLAALEAHLIQLAGSAIFEDTYREPFQYLVSVGGRERCYTALDLFSCFPKELKEGYFKALGDQEPVALLILAYWLAMVSTIKQSWITEPAISLCSRLYVHLLGVLPATIQGYEELLAPLARRYMRIV